MTIPDGFNAKQYVGIFLEETNQQIDRLEDGLVRLEAQPDDRELIQAASQSFHAIKGSASAVGFGRMMELAHLMEKVLDEVQGRRLRLQSGLIGALLLGVDHLKELRSEIARLGREPDTDTGSVVNTLNGFLSYPQPIDSSIRDTRVVLPDSNRNNQPMAVNQLSIRVWLNPDCCMKGVRAYLVINRLQEEGVEVVLTSPPLDDLESEQFGQEFSIMVETDKEAVQVRKIVESIAEINQAEIQSVDLALTRLSEHEVSPLEQTIRTDSRSRHPKKTVRIDVGKLDVLLNLVGELVIVQSRLDNAVQQLTHDHPGEESLDMLTETVGQVGRVTHELQQEIVKSRMVPLVEMFNRFSRLVRDLARQAGKQIECVMEGAETELDWSWLDSIADPIASLLRNAIDHGIETRMERVARHKPEQGTILLGAYPEAHSVVIVVRDDGRGISLEWLRDRGRQLGLFSEEDLNTLTEQDMLEAIFTPGFFTSETVTEVSGRGMDLDTVKQDIERINGQIQVKTVAGQGTSFSIRLPLIVAIISALLVRAGRTVYALPLSDVAEIEKVERKDTSWVNRQLTVVQQDRTIPLVRLEDVLHSKHAEFPEGTETPAVLYAVVVNTSSTAAGLLVDEIVGEQEIVIKPLGSYLGDIKGLGGATILGDGRISLILDVASLLRKYSEVGG